MAFTIINIKYNCFYTKPLYIAGKFRQSFNVDFLQRRFLIHIRVAVFKVEINLKGNTKGLPDWPSLAYED